MVASARTISDIVNETRNGRMSARQLTLESLERIDHFDATLKSFVKVDRERALADAEHLDRLAELGVPKGPLFGVPVAIKDIINVQGLPTQGGSLTRKDAVPEKYDAEVVTRLRQAGAVIMGKVATVEYAFGAWGTNSTVGAPMNPWDLSVHRIPGGSSSGSGVSVAAGLVAGALGSDTGGSIRLPASFSGLVGLKTSAGLLPTSGVLPLSETLDTIGPMARTVADVAILFDVLTGAMRFNIADVQTWGGSFGNWRIGIPTDLGVDLHPETAAIFEKAISQLRKAGATLVPVTLPSSVADYAAPCGMYLAVDGYRHYGHFADAEPSLIGYGVRERIMSGKAISAATYLTQHENRARETKTIESLYDTIDALFFPTTPMPAPVLGQHPEFESPAVFTRFANYFNLAAISLPVGITSLGLPVGMQFVVPRLREDRAIQLAQRFETMNGGPILCPLAESIT